MTVKEGMRREGFLTPEEFTSEQIEKMSSPRGQLIIAGCCSGTYLSRAVAEYYQRELDERGSAKQVVSLENIDKRFSDTETCVRLDTHVSGSDVYLFQTLFDPASGRSVDQNYMAFLIAARTFREHGAAKVTGVLPYLAYARQDKPTKFTREPTTARLMADLTVQAGIDRLVVWDPHCDQVRGFYGSVPVNALESLTLFVEEYARFRGRDDVIAVAPDAGASKFVTHFGRALKVKCAIAAKHRPEPERAEISDLIGDFSGKKVAIILDDMISGGGTIYALVRKLMSRGIEEVHVGASHNLCLPQARERLMELEADYNLREVVVTNSVPQTKAFQELPFMKVRCLGDTFGLAINRIHYNRSVSAVFYRP